MAGGAAPGASRNAALLYFIKAFVGPGCLSLPLAFQNAGLELGLVTLLTLAIGVTLNLRTLVLCKRYYATNGPPPTPGGRVHKTTTYADVAERALGKYGRMLVEVLVHVVQLGVCAVYFDFFGENMRALLPRKERVIADRERQRRTLVARLPDRRQAAVVSALLHPPLNKII